MNILKKSTKSICPVCFEDINGRVIEEKGKVYLIKECPRDGEFEVLIEKSLWLYKKLMNPGSLGIKERKRQFSVLAISATHSCNLSCSQCYLPGRDNGNFSLEEMKEIVSSFSGSWIRLSGGESTLREDLPQVIDFIEKQGKRTSLLTNGLKLAERSYVEKLKNAGLNWIHFSLNGFSDRSLEEIDGQGMLKTKLQALKNIKEMKIPTALSMVLAKGINDSELRKIYKFCLRNNSFICQLRIRSSIQVGRYRNEEYFYLSEIVSLLSKIIGTSEENIVNNSLQKGMYFSLHNKQHMPCHLEVDLFSLLMDELGLGRGGAPLTRKILAAFKLWSKIGTGNLIKMIIRKLKGDKHLLDFSIRLRVWPDKYRIDLGEIERCPSGYVTSNSKLILPFCYALILNEKNDFL